MPCVVEAIGTAVRIYDDTRVAELQATMTMRHVLALPAGRAGCREARLARQYYHTFTAMWRLLVPHLFR